MTRVAEAFAAAVARALASPEDGPLTARFPAALVTAIAAAPDPGQPGLLERALAATISRLEEVGVPRGRQYVLLAAGAPDPGALTASLRLALGVPVMAHDPAGPSFVAGHAPDGTPLELDDELREAEALVVVGPAPRDGGLRGGPFLLCPGLASARTALAWEVVLARGGPRAAWALALACEREARVDFAVLWDESGRVVAGGGRERFQALATAAGLR